MFSDMGRLPKELYQQLIEQTVRFLETAIPRDEYLGWLAAPADAPGKIIAGAGVQLRRTLPHPTHEGERRLVSGRQGIVLNVYTEREWRKQGLARRLMEEVLKWARSSGLETLVLHASGEGRPLYERLGFVQTNEMRFGGDLGAPRDPPG
jgi:GNAT superfamily N-acetyltransferase